MSNEKKMSQLDYIRHLWSELHEMGVIRNNSEQAIIKWAKNRFQGLDRLEWLNAYQKSKLIEGLKDWIAREKGKQHETA